MKMQLVVRQMMLAAVLTGCCVYTFTGNTQVAAAPKVAAGTIIEPAKSFDEMLTGFEGEMMGVAKAMPAEKYNFAPSAAVFASSQKTEYTGVRTFGAMVIHIAQANYFYGGAVGKMKPDIDVKALSDLKDKDKIVAALEQSFVFTHKAIATLTASMPLKAFVEMRHGRASRAVSWHMGSTTMANLWSISA